MSNSNTGAAAGGGAIYGLGIFGAWVFFWQQADGFFDWIQPQSRSLVVKFTKQLGD